MLDKILNICFFCQRSWVAIKHGGKHQYVFYQSTHYLFVWFGKSRNLYLTRIATSIKSCFQSIEHKRIYSNNALKYIYYIEVLKVNSVYIYPKTNWIRMINVNLTQSLHYRFFNIYILSVLRFNIRKIKNIIGYYKMWIMGRIRSNVFLRSFT